MSDTEHDLEKECNPALDIEQEEERKKEKLRIKLGKKIRKEEKKKKKKAEKLRKKFEADSMTKTNNNTNKTRRKGASRIAKEYKMVIESDICDIVLIDEDRLSEFLIRFTPKGGHYEGQTLLLSLKTNNPSRKNTYPFCCPYMSLITPIWHTNISTSGIICVDFLNYDEKWAPSFSFTTLIAQMQLLFSEPEISSGHYNMDATKMFRDALKMKDFTVYDRKCNNFYNKIPGLRKKLSNFEHLYRSQHPDREPVGF